MFNTLIPGAVLRYGGLAFAGLCLSASGSAEAQTFEASDVLFSPASWAVTVIGTSPTASGSGSQVVNGYAPASNAWLSTLSPGGNLQPAWNVSIFEGFSYVPAVGVGAPDVSISFDSRWVSRAASLVGPAVQQGSTIWAGWHSANTGSWQTFTFSGWSSILNGTQAIPGPDFSSGAAPIYFGFYQLNSGTIVGIQSEFSNFNVVVTAVPAHPVFVHLLAGVVCRRGALSRRRRSR